MNLGKQVISAGLDKVKDATSSVYDRTVSTFDEATSLITSSIGSLPLKALFLEKGDCSSYDEKHYFLVPYPESADGFTIFSLRWLPDGVPPLNDLPKRRVFHFPSEASEAQLREMIIENAKRHALEASGDSKSSFGDGLIGLANDIDRIEDTVTKGALLIGGLVALVNPVVGAGIAVKALLPGIGTTLGKYGLRNVGDKLNQMSVNRQIKNAETEILEQFRDSSTIKYVNPILTMTAMTLQDHEFDALDWIEIENQFVSDNVEKNRFFESATKAVCAVYIDEYSRSRKRSIIGTNKSWLPKNLSLWLAIHIR